MLELCTMSGFKVAGNYSTGFFAALATTLFTLRLSYLAGQLDTSIIQFNEGLMARSSTYLKLSFLGH